MAENTEEMNRSFDGFEDDEEREEAVLGEISGDGGRRRYFSKVRTETIPSNDRQFKSKDCQKPSNNKSG